MHIRPLVGRIVDPLAGGLLRAGVTPDAVTAVGTLGVIGASLAFLSRGSFLLGAVVVTLFVLTDVLDGTMARKRGTTSPFGAWLDSTCDRAADGAVFGSLVLWYSGGGDDRFLQGTTVYVLIASAVVSYAKARAEGLGLTCNVGIAERTERLILVLGACFLVGLGAPEGVLAGALLLLAALTTITVLQRLIEVRRQAGLQTR